nr:hypothetical protein [uncultured Duganella sp.]
MNIEHIKTWRERFPRDLMGKPSQVKIDKARDDEIADLRAALAARSAASLGQAIVPPVWISELCGPEVDDLSYGQGFRRGFNQCRDVVLEAISAHPAADAAPALTAKESDARYTQGYNDGWAEGQQHLKDQGDAEPVDVKPVAWCDESRSQLYWADGHPNHTSEGRQFLYFHPSTAQGDALSQVAGEPSTREQKLAGRVNWTTKQWYEHVGAWENEHDQIVFGSVMALRAMMVQFQAVTLYAADRRASQDSEHDSARWQFMVEVSAGPPALNTYAAALNEQPFILHETPATRKAAFIAAVDKARQKMAEQQTQEGGAA